MKITLEAIGKIVAQVKEEEYQPVKSADTFEDLGVDSLGLLMVIVGVATECNMYGTEEEIVKLVTEIKTVGDVLKYVKSHPG